MSLVAPVGPPVALAVALGLMEVLGGLALTMIVLIIMGLEEETHNNAKQQSRT